MGDRERAMVFASFAGDALALGVHWIYSTGTIEREFRRVRRYLDPRPDSYHPTKTRGEFTHYGDQTFVLLESLAHAGGFDPEDFSRRWRALFDCYTAYRDQATRTPLENLDRGTPFMQAGSPSNDLSGACRIAPLVYALRRDEGRLVQAARTQTALTHTDPLTVDAAEFFARWALGVLSGMQPVDAMAEVVQAQFAGTGLEQAVQKGLSLRGQGVVQAVKALGQDCHSPHALPSVVQIVAAHEDDLEEALVDNVMAGGDSAARGMLVGMILGASCGMEAIPGDWIEGMRRARDIDEMLSRLG